MSPPGAMNRRAMESPEQNTLERPTNTQPLYNETASRVPRPHEHLVFPEPKPFQIPEVDRFSYRGIEFFLLHNNELPLITLQVLVNGGSWMDPDGQAGLAALTGTVMRLGGSQEFPGEALNEQLENRAASIETSFGLTTGTARMNVLSEDFDELLPVFTGLLQQPAFPEDRIQLAKMQYATSISRRNENPSNVASREFRKLVYGPESVYARSMEYATLQAITRDDLLAFHRKTYQGSNMLVSVTGDFDVLRIREQLKEAFRILDLGYPVDTTLPEVMDSQKPGLYLAHKQDMTQSQIRLGHLGGYRENPDYAALQILNEILSGGFSGRLLQRVRTEQGLAYSVYGAYTSNVRFPGIFFTGLSTAAETSLQALESTLAEIRLLQEEPAGESEFNEARERIFNRIIFRYDSYDRILNERVQNYNLGLPEDTFDQYLDQLRQVSVQDIQRVAREYLHPDRMVILIVTHRELLGSQLEELRERFGEYHPVDLSIPPPDAAAGRPFP